MTAVLEARGICKYFLGLKAVENVDMVVNEGDILGIIGPNGAGKTTFFNVCSGVYQPDSGEVLLHGERISGLNSESIAKKGMTRTFQNIQLFKFMTVLENIKTGFHLRTRTRIWDALWHNKVFLQDEKIITEKGLEILKKVGLEEYQDTLAGNLSYGLQRKVEIARAMALEPKMLLLDEPAAGMNPRETKSLMEFIRQLNAEGCTIAVIEHDMKFVMNLCNRIIVLNFGEKICEGTPYEVKADPGVQEAYFGRGIIAGTAGIPHA